MIEEVPTGDPGPKLSKGQSLSLTLVGIIPLSAALLIYLVVVGRRFWMIPVLVALYAVWLTLYVRKKHRDRYKR